MFAETINKNENNPIKMKILNLKNNTIREIVITPTIWDKSNPTSLLGISTQFDLSFDELLFIRVLEVEKDSPAFVSKLEPFNGE